MDMLLNTPVEKHRLKNRDILVKRDDLMGDGTNLPPWGKMAAIYELVDKYVDKSKPLTHLSVDEQPKLRKHHYQLSLIIRSQFLN